MNMKMCLRPIGTFGKLMDHLIYQASLWDAITIRYYFGATNEMSLRDIGNSELLNDSSCPVGTYGR
jgi:hypothetical protein